MVWIEGEVSNLRKPPSGHLYFTLKDERAQIAAVLFRGDQRAPAAALRDGARIRAYGQITVYEPGGQYQIVVRKVEDAGKGSLQEAFEALKKKLAAEGLFDAARKRPLPRLPRHIGVVTSPSGAAIRDILKILGRRFPNLHVVIAPVRVQGDGAAEEIAAALDLLNARGGLDVIIAGRGGGSIEDLWCFNEEAVGRAIARSAIPVISAVGHETDFTISDFVADVRAPTPSAAAEMVVDGKDAFEEDVRRFADRLVRALRAYALEIRNRLDQAGRSYVFREPRNLLRRHAQRLEMMRAALRHHLVGAGREARQRADQLGMRLAHRLELRQREARQALARLEVHLRALNPAGVLERGYSITRRASGEILRGVEQVKAGEPILTDLARGRIRSSVTSTEQRGKSHG
jgi:exodeoxyribonuclease VII large subunit